MKMNNAVRRNSGSAAYCAECKTSCLVMRSNTAYVYCALRGLLG
jgi:hypothetical protein